MESGKRRVMVAVDEREGSFYALEWALNNLYQSISNSHLFIFTVQPFSAFTYTHVLQPRDVKKELQEDQRKAAAFMLDSAKEMCSKYNVTPELVAEVGDPKDAIKAAVERLNISLLIVGSHGEGALRRDFLGSVTNYLVHHAKCQVLVVKKPT